MNKSDPPQRIAGETGPAGLDAEVAVNSMPSGIAGSLARGEAISLLGFGTFGMWSCEVLRRQYPTLWY